MLQPLFHSRGAAKSVQRSAPPPIGGWNARDALDQMPQEDAVVLDNWFPRTSDIISRKGYSLHASTGETGNVQTLVEYQGATARKLIAAVSGKVYDVTSASPSSLGTGFSNNRWHCANYKDRLFMVNGTDTPQTYDGSTLASSGWSGSGLTVTNLKAVMAFKSRLYFAENNSQKVWYTGTAGAVTGALDFFDLGTLGNFGGTLRAMGIVTQDGGDGVDDLICFFMASGDVIIYQGSNPGDATAWALVGVFKVGSPIDQWSTAKIGAECLVITLDGYLPLTRVLAFGRSKQGEAISDKIQGAAQAAVRAYKDNTGWQPFLYPKGQMLLINVPTTASAFVQHVMNTETRAWCRFTGISSCCWSLYNDNPYFGGASGKVYKFDDTFADNSAAITTDGQTAWNYYGDRTRIKRFTAARPILIADGASGAQIALGVDFTTIIPTNTVSTPASTSTAVWDVDVWDVGIWGGAELTSAAWQSVAGIGRCASLRLRTANTAKQVRWQAMDVMFEPGAGI